MLCTYQLDYHGIYSIATPYENYDEFDFSIPVGRHGDCYDRYLIRIQEMRESINIIQQAIEKLNNTQGPIKVENYKVIAPPSKYH